MFFVTVNMDAPHSDSSYVDPFAAVEAPETETTEAPWGKGDIGWGVLGALLSIPFAIALGVVLLLSLEIGEAALTLAVSGFIEVALVAISWRYSVHKYHCSWGLLGFRNRWRIVNLAMVGAGLVLALASAIIYGGILRAVGLGDSLPSAPLSKSSIRPRSTTTSPASSAFVRRISADVEVDDVGIPLTPDDVPADNLFSVPSSRSLNAEWTSG